MTAKGKLTKASFTPLNASGHLDNSRSIKVHFNPATLQFSIANTLENKGNGNSKKQYVTQSTAKLTMDLVFDTTDSGVDVRNHTGKLASFMSPSKKGKKKVPSIVKFEWGKYQFQGMIEAYKETIDFFAADGVPLRSNVNLTLADQDKVFEASAAPADKQAKSTGLNPDDIELPGGSFSPAQAANQAGQPQAARTIAAANGQDSLRFNSGPLVVSDAIALGGPAALSAGATISAGAFAGLHSAAGSIRKSTSLDIDALLPGGTSAKLATDAGASFGVGGQAKIEGSATLGADVGVGASLADKLQFD